MDFLIFRPLSPETGYHLFLGLGGLWSKVCVEKFVLSGV